ncbi:UPF0175 family protein [Pasteurella atlantica]|uniref:UPF0175 family protein n=1 Tax=Pasteurellaceae TaxID=712 RepID=UPI00274BDCF5|nr:UPF0175 family protein [Pasteurella atlantica]MDP8034577.1 UPF0175 family protein [Pasteurella atlantica]MDP8036547.1 UPF0175 family protein [Pasteurella atlantica]MDP8038440.1 UPF0175 family protein [Pasteurella atlantica]MDP8048844.1 UPF0175 family protein [Pasteurella atlantica]MDP8050784.1 UPF0175 family protein [Pasteurella atlantica]
MKTVGIRSLRENPSILNQCASLGEYVLLTNRNQPMSLSIPFTQGLLDNGVHISMAVSLFEQGQITLTKAAKIAKMSVQDFLLCLNDCGVTVVEQSQEELQNDLKTLGLE